MGSDKAINAHFEEQMAAIFPITWQIEPNLQQAMQYSLLAGGKRVRPLLLLAATEAVGGNVSQAYPAACAIECVHTYSLIHDDLPAMDNDALRRGKPTNHIVFGEATAILAGDALLTHAFYVLATMPHVSDAVVRTLVTQLAYYAGAAGMVSGQAIDMAGQAQTAADVDYMHQRKTGDLIVCALQMGAHLGGASAQQLDALAVFGRAIGLAFQIQDDILDATGDTQTTGKMTQRDVENNKKTYTAFVGVEASRQAVRTLTHQGHEAIIDASFPYPQRLIELSEWLMARHR